MGRKTMDEQEILAEKRRKKMVKEWGYRERREKLSLLFFVLFLASLLLGFISGGVAAAIGENTISLIMLAAFWCPGIVFGSLMFWQEWQIYK